MTSSPPCCLVGLHYRCLDCGKKPLKEGSLTRLNFIIIFSGLLLIYIFFRDKDTKIEMAGNNWNIIENPVGLSLECLSEKESTKYFFRKVNKYFSI